ncbi:sn-1-specific diacylglycerol lipase ABHD11 [Anolis sagrei]|uniref:sn-1-specific diacylglycerol lipase ABHD11 n=1 Tax=Anolis sagrei TaxID=38937 RepID=UPI003520422F
MLRALGFPRCPLRCPRVSRRSFADQAATPVPVSYCVFDGASTQPPLVFLHGLFGSKGNFASLAKEIVRRSGRKVLTVDARNHGDSPHHPLMTYEAMSDDVHLLLLQLHLERCVLVGHSMGGRTAMAVALRWPELVERLLCVDISPRGPSAVSKFHPLVEALKAVELPEGVPLSTARRLAQEQLRNTIQDPPILQFLLTNLVSSEGRIVWRVNLDAVSRHLDGLMHLPDFQASYLGPVLFLGGAKSPYISSEDFPDIERLFPEAEIEYIPDAGHWVHADQPQHFVAAVCRFMEQPPP